MNFYWSHLISLAQFFFQNHTVCEEKIFQNNQDISSAYESYLQYFRETFLTIPPPSFQAWLQLVQYSTTVATSTIIPNYCSRAKTA